jgi:hypothetical protein
MKIGRFAGAGRKMHAVMQMQQQVQLYENAINL